MNFFLALHGILIFKNSLFKLLQTFPVAYECVGVCVLERGRRELLQAFTVVHECVCVGEGGGGSYCKLLQLHMNVCVGEGSCCKLLQLHMNVCVCWRGGEESYCKLLQLYMNVCLLGERGGGEASQCVHARDRSFYPLCK